MMRLLDIPFPADKTVFALFRAGSPLKSTISTILWFMVCTSVSMFYRRSLKDAESRIVFKQRQTLL